MVSGAVVVSSHTTSVRAANLLASFIIIPMAFLLQGESILLFWGQYDAMWFILAALVVANILLIRTGIRTFNREEILAREIDEINLKSMLARFRTYFIGTGFSLVRIYRDDVPRLLRENRLPIFVTTLAMLGGMILGWVIAWRFPLPSGAIPFRIDAEAFKSGMNAPGYSFLPSINTWAIFANNIRALLLASLLGLFSFGSLALILLLIPMAIVGFFAGEMIPLGSDPLTFLTAFILPHGVVELPAAIIATAFALRLGASIIAPPPGVTAGENLLRALAELLKVFLLVVLPLLLIAAWIEVNITPQIVIYFYGR
jgi:uncharacterized membrane protein SpoIIM required for sporulation